MALPVYPPLDASPGAAAKKQPAAAIPAIQQALPSEARAALMTAIGELKVTAYRNGLTDTVLDEELRYRAYEERQGGIR